MNIGLHKWALKNQSSWPQIMFVRDVLSRLFEPNSEKSVNFVKVINTHTSRSVMCPVYYMDINGVLVWMRYNFYNWNISIESNIPITCDFLDTFSDEYYDYCFCEGMENKHFQKYSDNNQKFTICISNDYNMYTFFKCLKRFLQDNGVV